jgi:hypothetical protein
VYQKLRALQAHLSIVTQRDRHLINRFPNGSTLLKLLRGDFRSWRVIYADQRAGMQIGFVQNSLRGASAQLLIYFSWEISGPYFLSGVAVRALRREAAFAFER